MLTVREIKDIIRQNHLSISKHRGQNFLVDEQIKMRIIDAIGIKPADYVLEIGPGFGALTEDLLQKAASVIAVEKDGWLSLLLRKRLSQYSRLQIICEDILDINIRKLTKKKVKVVGNLPYYITTPIISYLLEDERDSVKEIYITVQEEVARRIIAKPKDRENSAITLFVQFFAKPQLLFSIPKRAFYPQPEVNSAFIQLQVLERPCVSVHSQEQFFRIIRACFNQRRKTILNSLSHKLDKIEKSSIEQLLLANGFDLRLRPEQLSLNDFAKIEDIFYKEGIRL